jgi:hypothetical protein
VPVSEFWKLLLGRGSRSDASPHAPDQPGNGPRGPQEEESPPARVCGDESPGGCGYARATGRERGGDANYGSPGRARDRRTLNRKRFLGSGLVAAAGSLGGYAATAGAAESIQVWGLDPSAEAEACSSCIAHAANKLFASAAAADLGRAHTYCKCSVVPLVQLDKHVYDSLFTNGGGRDSVDRRYQWVQAIFAQAPAAGLTSIDAPTAGRLRLAPAQNLHAVMGYVRVRHSASGQRVLVADIVTDQPVTASIAILRHGPTVARRVVADVSGTRRLRLLIPPGTKGGPARVWLRFRTASGATRVITRGIQIPRI